MVECCEEDTLGVFLVKDGIDSCKVGFLPRYLVPRMKMFNGAVAQVVEMIDPEDSNKFVQKRYEKFRGFCRCVLLTVMSPTGSIAVMADYVEVIADNL